MPCLSASVLCSFLMSFWGDVVKKMDIINRLTALNFDRSQYWLIAGSAMVFYEIRNETRDIDLGCTQLLADQLEQQGFPTEYLSDGTRKITCGQDVEIFENWLYDSIQFIDDFPVISLAGLLEMKAYLGREKDHADIHLIKNYIAKNWQL